MKYMELHVSMLGYLLLIACRIINHFIALDENFNYV